MLNTWFFLLLLIVVGLYALNVIASLLNLKALQPKLPQEFADTFDAEKYTQSQEYTRAHTRFDLVESTFSLLVFLAFWLLGGFPWLDGIIASWGWGPVGTGLAFFGLLFLANTLLGLPFNLYDTFVLEERFGFNQTTPATFVADFCKNLALAALLGLPLLALLLWIFATVPAAWFWAWIVVSAFSLLLTWLAPTYLLPLFNKFQALEDGELKNKIHAMAEKCHFPLTEISIMDGSKRSAKANAFFTGFGKRKKIALYDTLVEKQTTGELVAVLAHEIGHFKKKHIHQTIVLSLLQTGLLFFLLGLFLNQAGLYEAFGVDTTSGQLPVYLGILFFTVLFKPISRIIGIGMNIFSRKNEFEADAYAAEVTSQPNDLVTALKKLSASNLSNLTPHPLHVFMDHSHPPVLQRIRALRTLAVATP
ncbi:MAG: M48 family metallopeptidase [Verrucomicrobiota bacterium]